MKKLSRNELRLKRKRRIQANVLGNEQKPRLAIFRSLRGVYVQVIDDVNGKTLASASLKDISIKPAKNNMENATKIGEIIAQKCSKIKIEKVTFDRAGYKYHGKVKALADGARKGGLKF